MPLTRGTGTIVNVCLLYSLFLLSLPYSYEGTILLVVLVFSLSLAIPFSSHRRNPTFSPLVSMKYISCKTYSFYVSLDNSLLFLFTS
jgi:hypothetical protein